MKIIMYHPDKIDASKEVKKEGFNWGGLILGPVLYLGWGMWRKSVILIGVMLLLFILQDIFFEIAGMKVNQSIFGKFVMIYSGFKINKDNYNHLLKRGWKEKR